MQKYNNFCETLQSVTGKHSPSTKSNLAKNFHFVVVHSYHHIPVFKQGTKKEAK